MPQSQTSPISASTSQSSKRKHLETSPNVGVADLVGNVEVSHLIVLMTESMEKIINEKLKILATKDDMEEIKQQINEVDVKVDTKFEVLQTENEAPKKRNRNTEKRQTEGSTAN